jgi:adenine-specific DNA-methyltransferase
MNKKQKLELTWIGKDNQPKLEPRILIEDPELSYGDKHTENILIYGDNLLALKALEQDFAGKIRCIYIDPPFNTGQAFEHYDDGIEHSLWLSLMRDRLNILKKLLCSDGSIWVHCDDNEQAYLKVLMDELFGRSSFIATVVWQSRYSRSNDAILSMSHNFILVYSLALERWKSYRNRLPRTQTQAGQYKNPDGDSRGPWRAIPWDAPNLRPNLTYPITTPTGRVRMPPPGRCWSRTEDQWKEIVEAGLAYFGKSGDGAPSFKQFLKDAAAIVPNTWWAHEDTGHTDEAKKEGYSLFSKEDVFATPKPERLLQRIITIATNPGDIVLDSFLGSGTTAAVAHKMGRKWIGIELGEHCHTHCLPRLKKVVDGTDQGGISKAVNWHGGGGFKYYYLAPSLLKEDKYGNWIIDERYKADMLAAAMAKHEGFKYLPDEQIYWKQGKSTEKDYIFTTTNFVTVKFLDKIHEEMQPGESLLICCKSFQVACETRYPNITVKKIPKMLLGRCEFGKEDYSLKIVNMPVEQYEPDVDPAEKTNGKKKKGKKSPPLKAPALFSEEDAD